MANFIFITVVLIFAQAVNGKPGMFDSALRGVNQAMGTVGNAISPSALMSFCNQNGYTTWVGQGPEPKADGLIGSAWSAWGTLTGAGWGAVSDAAGLGAGIQGQCDAAGWAKPGSLASSGSIRIQSNQPWNAMGSQQPNAQYYPGRPYQVTTYSG